MQIGPRSVSVAEVKLLNPDRVGHGWRRLFLHAHQLHDAEKAGWPCM